MFQLAPPPPVGPQGVGGSTEGGGGGGLLRIAYLSSDFGDHTTGVNIGGIFKEHDSSRVKVFGYATSEDDGSAVRQRIERECHLFRDLHELRCVYVCILCIYIFLCMYVYIYIHVHIYISTCLCIHTWTHTHIYIYTRIERMSMCLITYTTARPHELCPNI